MGAFFNQANQFAEPPMQRLALANAVVAYASNVDTLANVSGAVNLIAHKHCGLGVEPEHYGIVHKKIEKGFISNLMHGLKEGDVVELSPPFGVFNLKPENKCV